MRVRRSERRKAAAELAYWRRQRSVEGELHRAHYEHMFTTLFGLARADYVGKRVLDVGCGPRGSLEWATMAARRVGVDPLVPEYARLRRAPHETLYLEGRAEAIPVASGSFDVIGCMNALDHVREVDAALRELDRVCAPDGLLLLVVEMGHPPTITEPHTLSWNLLDRLRTAFEPELVRRLAKSHSGIYESVLAAEPLHSEDPLAPGILCARLRHRRPGRIGLS